MSGYLSDGLRVSPTFKNVIVSVSRALSDDGIT